MLCMSEQEPFCSFGIIPMKALRVPWKAMSSSSPCPSLIQICMKIINAPTLLREMKKMPTHPSIDSVQRPGYRGLLV